MPQVDFHPLTRADGSATYTDQLFSILAGVNGPVEVQRRDELPEEAAIEVNIRPLSGIGGPRERWLEDRVHSVLESILLTHISPRTLFQITLQITKEPKEKLRRDITTIYSLPSLINAAFVALVDSGLPLRTTAAAILATGNDGLGVTIHPIAQQLKDACSVHAMAYDAEGSQLLHEMAGGFGGDQLSIIDDASRAACKGAFEKETDEVMADTDIVAGAWLRQALQEKARDAAASRANTAT